MNTPKLDVDSLIEALRGDLPSEREEARVRARLVAAGVVAATAMTSAEVAANSFTAAGAAANSVAGNAVASNVVGTAAGAAAGSVSGAVALGAGTSAAPLGALPVGLAQAGLWSKVIALPLAAKIGIAGTVAIGVAAGSVPALREVRSASGDGATVVAVERASEPSSRSKASGPRAALPMLDDRAAEPSLGSAPAAAAHEDPTREPSVEAPAGRAVEPPPALDARSLSVADEPRATKSSAATSAPAAPRASAPASVRAAHGTRAARIEPSAPANLSVASAARVAAPSVVAGEPGATSAGTGSGDAPTAAKDTAGDARVESSRARTPNAYASTSTLAEETGLMERAIAALHEGDLDRARHWLHEHERRFPQGLLARERFRALASVERQAR